MTDATKTAAATPENLESVMRRIQKLLAIAADDRANPEEASAAAGMAERIMRKYQIEHVDVVLESLRKADDMHTEESVCGKRTKANQPFKAVPPWAQWIAVQVAKVNGCGVKLRTVATGDKGLQFYGFRSDVMVAKFTFDYLVTTLARLCEEFKKTDADRSSVDSYRKGVATGMYTKLVEQLKQKEQELKASSTGTAIVVAKASAVAEYGGEFKTRKGASTTRDGEAFGAGVQHGKAVDMNRRGVTGSASATLRLGN